MQTVSFDGLMHAWQILTFYGWQVFSPSHHLAFDWHVLRLDNAGDVWPAVITGGGDGPVAGRRPVTAAGSAPTPASDVTLLASAAAPVADAGHSRVRRARAVVARPDPCRCEHVGRGSDALT